MAKSGGVNQKREFLDEVAAADKRKHTRQGKPHIDEVQNIFHAHRVKVSRIMRQHKPMSVEMVVAFDVAKAELQKRLADIGLADLIDFRDR